MSNDIRDYLPVDVYMSLSVDYSQASVVRALLDPKEIVKRRGHWCLTSRPELLRRSDGHPPKT